MARTFICFVLVTFLCTSHYVAALKILGVAPLPSPSHQLWFKHLMKGLARKGHQVYTLSPEPIKMEGDEVAQNLTSMVFEGTLAQFRDQDTFHRIDWPRISPLEFSKFVYEVSDDSCREQIKTEGAKRVLELVKNTEFDVILQDLLTGQCFYGLWEVARGNPGIVGYTPFGVPHWIKEVVGGQNWPAIRPYPYLHAQPSNLWERTWSFIYYQTDDILRRFHYMPMQQKFAEEFIGTKLNRSIIEVEKRVSVMMTNSYPVLEPAIFLPPNVIEVGGLHVGDPKPLPEDIQKFLDEAEHEVVVISLGTNVQSSTLGPRKLGAIVGALRRLKQRVLWKFEAEDLKDKPDNVMIKKWLPQSDVLAHPKVRVLWTHAGLLSTQEAVWRGIPVIGMPFFMDQFANIDRITERGAGLRLDHESLSIETISEVLDNVLTDPSFDIRMKQLSREYTDRPMSPLDLAIWHVEYASRHPRGTLASPARDLTYVQFNLLDVYAVLGAAVLSISLILWLFLRALLNLLHPQQKIKTA